MSIKKMNGISLVATIILLSSLNNACFAQTVYECPQDWFPHSDHCYHFMIYPTLPFDEASQACHQDGASLVSVNTPEENTFIIGILPSIDEARPNKWYTSGLQRAGRRQWSGDGSAFSAQDSYWVTDPNTEDKLASMFSEAQLIYQYSDERKVYSWTWGSRTQSLPYICEIERNEVYRITQKNRDFGFGQPSNNPNTWLTGPKFTFVSKSVVFTEHLDQFSIECLATANPRATFKWYKDYATPQEALVVGTDRQTITNGRLTFSHPRKEDDSSTYTCVAQNSVGTVFSGPVLVAAGDLGEFSNDPPGFRTAILYQGTTLDCSPIRFNPALTYQWMKGDRFIRPEMNPHTFLSENGNLYFSEVQAADAESYKCIVTLTAGAGQELATEQPEYRISLGIPLQIRGENANEFGPDIHDDFPAVFPQQPLVGQELRIECFAYGRLPLHYSWQRVDGNDIPYDRVSFSSLSRIMTIRAAKIEDSGTYMCSVNGPVSVHTKNITVSVAAAPYFMFPLRDQHLDVGSQLTWVCDAVAIPRATYTWFRDAQVLVTDPANDIQVQGNVVTITSADAAKHNGMYECRAANNHGTYISIAQIRVLSFKPNFNLQPVETSLMGTSGGNLTIQCRPEAAPQPTITWFHNNSPIGSSGRSKIFPNGDLALTGLSTGDSGEYKCTAENTLGSASSIGHLMVLGATTLVQRPDRKIAVQQNSTARIPCQASYNQGKTDLVYVWYFNGYPVDFKNDVSYLVTTTGGSVGLNVIAAQFRHEGRYECRATTVYDSASAFGDLTVMGSPEEPGGVHLHSQINGEVVLFWQKGQDHNDPIIMYRIDFNNEYNGTWLTLVSDIPAHTTSLNAEFPNWQQHAIPDSLLSPGTSYRFRVAAASANFGYGMPSSPSDKVPIADAPPNHAVEIVDGGGGSVGMLRVKWQPLPPEHHGGEGLYYKVFWRQSRDRSDQWMGSKEPLYGDNPDRDGWVYFETQTNNRDLYYTKYDVKVQAINDKGAGPNSTVTTIFSAEDIPIATPQNVKVECINSTACIVYWEMLNNTREGLRGKVSGYQINWWLWGDDNARSILHFTRHYGTAMNGMVIGLPYANKNYWVDVQVFNTAGLGRPSGRAYMNTNYEAPLHYPDMVTVQSHGRDSVRVTWRGVSTLQIESPVTGYTIWYWPAMDDIRTAKKAVFPKQFTGIVYGLEKDMLYKLRVLATNAGGEGKKTPPTYFTLGGQVRFDPLTTEIMASASFIKPSIVTLACVFIVSLLQSI